MIKEVFPLIFMQEGWAQHTYQPHGIKPLADVSALKTKL